MRLHYNELRLTVLLTDIFAEAMKKKHLCCNVSQPYLIYALH